MTAILSQVPSLLTPHDLEERKDYITASEVAAIMGTSPWKSPADVYYEKMMDLEPSEPSDAMAWGSLMEVILVKWARHAISRRLGTPVQTTRQGCRRKHNNGIMSATLDARVIDLPYAIECKTHALTYRKPNLDEWGAAWSDEIPAYYLDQVLSQLACSPDLERIYVVLCLGFTMPRVYQVERQHHRGRIAEIEDRVCDWWEAHIIPGVPPTGAPSMATVDRMNIQKVAGVTATGIPDHLLERRKQVGTLLGTLEKEKKELDAQIKLALGVAMQGQSVKGHRVVVVPCHKDSYTVQDSDYCKTHIYLIS
jgi:putative phage-type endonuclease